MAPPLILQIRDIYYPVLTAFGTPANICTIVILFRGNCGLSKCISLYMVAMATADLMVMTSNVIVYHIFMYHFPDCFLSYTAVCKFMIYINYVSLGISVWFTVSFTCDRFVSICCEKFKTKYCTVQTAAVVVSMVTVLFCVQTLPFFFTYKPERTIHNIQWGCQPRLEFFSSPAGVTYSWLQSALNPCLPFILILFFNAFTVRRILVVSRSRKRLRAHSSENQSDPEMENRRKSIILLFTVSSSFVVLWLTSAVSFITTSLSNTAHYRGDYAAPEYIATETGFILMYLSSCTNTCIYAATQTKFREELKKILTHPWTLCLNLVKITKT